MRYTSTQDALVDVSFSEALLSNLPKSGGLYVPRNFPKFDFQKLIGFNSYADLAAEILQPFTDFSPADLKDIAKKAFNFPVPLTTLDESLFYLELFHGPTAAFKDFGARFLAQSLKNQSGTVLVATSGDTGGAVASAFWQLPGFKVRILFPKGMVSRRQELQLTNWGFNVASYAVRGTFDDCQRLVKTAFAQGHADLRSANSINIGRILPQMVYYAYASILAYKKNKNPSRVIIPSGNAGNACAAVWAKQIGFPIQHVVMACNANQTLSDYFKDNIYRPRPSISTLANAMDVGHPSNFERIRHLYSENEIRFKKDISAYSVSDTQISQTITRRPYQQIICPHTATAFYTYETLEKEKDENTILVGTASAAKFETVVEPLIQETIPIPKMLEETLQRPSHFQEISADENEFLELIRK